MKWKNFFKPTIVKIALFVIVLVISIKFSILLAYYNVCPFVGICATPPCICTGFQLITTPFLFENYGARYPYGIFGDSNVFSINLITLIANAIAWYIVSCLIVWIYNKVKKK